MTTTARLILVFIFGLLVAAAIILPIGLSLGRSNTGTASSSSSNSSSVSSSTSVTQQDLSREVEGLISTAIKADESWGKPTVSTITDLVKVKSSNPEFFANAQSGDWLVVYTLKKKVVLYRAETNMIIKYGDLI